MAHEGADAQRGDGRQLDRFERGGGRQQMPIDFDEAALIHERRLDEAVAIPLLDEIGRPAAGRARFGDLEQQRPEPRRGQSVRERVVGFRR